MMGLDNGRRMLDQETSKPTNLSETIQRFAAYFRRYWLGGAIAILLIVAATWTQVVSPDIIGQAVDCYLFPQPQLNACWFDPLPEGGRTIAQSVSGLGGLVLLLVGLFVAGSAFNGMAFYTMNWTGQNVLRQLRQDLFTQIHRLSMGYYARNEAGDIMSRVTNDTDTIQQAFSFALLNVFSGILLIVWIMVRMLQANVAYAVISLLTLPVMLIATNYFSSQARKAFRRARQEMGSVNADLQESISGAREVQAFNREDESIAQFQTSNEANRAANIRAAAFTSALRPVLEALGYVSLGIVVLTGGLSLLRNEPLFGTSVVSLGLIFAFVNYVQRVNQPIQQIALLWTNVQNAIAGGERIFNLLDVVPDVQNKDNAQPLPPIKGRVTFENVHAEYVEGEPVLQGVSFDVDQGQMVAIVGPTGAGKTTIINMIPRFYDVTNGSVQIDGYDVRDVAVDSLRSQVGIVLQDTFLFSDTVLENIRYGRLDATDDDVIEAAKMVAAHDFIERLPEGYNTILGERGGGLSQGQRQLIAIARVALMNPNILILDEATSSVDTRTERIIQSAFEVLLEGRTSFVIAHRLSTIRNADLVMMLKDGLIIERGTHQSLLAEKGEYYTLYMSQFKDEEEAIESQPAGD